MLTFEGLDENFRFLILEVESQARALRKFLSAPTQEGYARITARDDYIDNLKTIIENKCYSRIHTDKELDSSQLNKIRAMQVCCVNLERIADYFVNIVEQVQYLEDQSFLHRFDMDPMFRIIFDALSTILPAFRDEDMAGALAICKSEPELDTLYKESFDRILHGLSSGKHSQTLVTLLFIIRYFERAGDSMLNIGEAIIFSILGERIKIRQFEALQQTLSKSGFSGSFSDIDFQAIWGTRSGCRIGKVDEKGVGHDKDKHGGIYKEGNSEKIRIERANTERWKEIFPHLVADIYGYHENDDTASILVEFLPGCTLDEVILFSDEEVKQNALFIFEQTVLDTWTTTLRAEPARTDYIRQVQSRLNGILQVHPEFWRSSAALGEAEVRSCEELLSACAEAEKELEAPFTVFIHGDFNSNNIVYNHSGQQIHYIDLYRSRDYDYIQDVSVFLVSNFRTPVFEPGLRARLNAAIRQFYGFAKTFAAKHEDNTFEARLAFALARSFYTSTRFELNHKFAKEMFNRSVFLLEKIYHFQSRDWERFSLPEDILYYR